jgi:hypothetical protein
MDPLRLHRRIADFLADLVAELGDEDIVRALDLLEEEVERQRAVVEQRRRRFARMTIPRKPAEPHDTGEG